MTRSNTTAQIAALAAQVEALTKAVAGLMAQATPQAAPTPAPTPEAPQYKRWDAEKYGRVVAKLRTISEYAARLAYLKACVGIDPRQKEAAYNAAKA
jgi:hypothetical protein